MPNEPIDPKKLPDEEADRRKLAAELRDGALRDFRANQPLVASLAIADALLLGPNERETLDAFDEIVFASPDPLALFPVATGAIHVATAAARARVLMIQRRIADALDLLGLVIEAAPELEYLDWARRWLQPHVIPELGFDRILGSILKPALTTAIAVPVPPDPRDRRLPNLRAAGDILTALQPVFPDQKIVWMGSAIVRRRLGDTAATLAAAEEGVRRFPQDWSLRTAWLNALRDAKRPGEALEQARVALQLDPADSSPLHDAAHGFLDAGRPAEAAPLFQELLQRSPGYPGADACLYYARFKANGAPDDRAALLAMRDRRPFDRAAAAMADEIDPPIPYVNVLPGPTDATAHFARDVVSDFAELLRCCGRGASIDLTIQSRYPESPSAAIAFDYAMRSMGAASARLAVEIDAFQQPDPRVDKAQVAMPIFQPRGNMPGPIAQGADPNLASWIGSVAYPPFRKDTWDAAAQKAAQQLGPAAAPHLLAVLHYPPPPPAEIDPVSWFYRCQVATAVVLSHMGPWATGPARPALYSMVAGPSDWVTIAGIVALAWRAGDGPEMRAEIEGVFSWLRTQIPREGFTPWEGALAYAWRSLGTQDEGLRQALATWIDEYERTLPSKNAVRALRRHAGMTLEEYAEFSVKRDRIIAGLGYPGPGKWMQGFAPPPALVTLCQARNLDPRRPFVDEWQEALNASRGLNERFVEARRTFELKEMGVSSEEKDALDVIRDGNMDMHLRMAQAQEAQAKVAAGGGGDPDPVVFPGQRVAKLSDYVGILKGMQTGNMMGALASYGLDMMSYGAVAQAWGAKMSADPTLTEKFNQMMQAR